jgi:PAS domain S-box-containing protein
MALRPTLAIRGSLLAGFVLGLVVFVALGVTGYRSARSFADTADWVRHTIEVLAKLQEMHANVAESQIAVRGFLLTGRDDFLDPYQEGLAKLEEDERELRRLTADNPIQQARLGTLEDLIRERRASSAQTLDVYHRQGAATALMGTVRGQELIGRIASVVEEMARTERELLAEREARNKAVMSRTFWILPVGTLLGAGILLAVLFFLNAGAIERRQAEAARRDAVAILESTDDAVITKTLDGIITSWNPGAQRIFGYTAQEAVGRPVLMIIPPERASEEEEILERIARGKRVEHFETVRVGQDGRPLDVSVTVSPVKDDAGRIIGASKILRDVTERKASAEALQQLGVRLTTTLENMSVAFFTVDCSWRFTYLNRECERLLQRTRAELLGRGLWDEFPEAVGGPSDRHYHLAMSENHAMAFEEFYPPLGRWLEVNAHPSPDGLAVYFRDVTERKQAAETLRESEERFSAAFRSSPVAIAINRRRDQICVEVNDTFLRLFELAREDVVGRTLVDLDLMDQPSVESIRAQLAATGRLDDAEVPSRTSHGRPLTISVSVRVLQLGGEPCALSILVDTTERREAEERVRQLHAELEQRVVERTQQLEAANTALRHSRAELTSLFESLPGLYLVLTTGLEIVAASDAYLKATLTTREDIVGRGLFDVFPDNPGDPGTNAVSNMRASIDRVLRNAAPDTMAIQKHDVRRPDGFFEEHYWSPINSPMFGADHQVQYIVHRVEEVTEFVRRESGRLSPELSAREQRMAAEIFQSSQNLQATNQQLEDANKELEAFSYSVSHDLRAPLRTVDGFSQALLEDFGPQLPEEGQRQLRTIREGAQRMGALIDDLLAFSRLGRQSLARTDVVDMDSLVSESLEDLQGERQGRRLEITAAPLPPGRGDRALLKQVWANLLSNAIKYTRPRDPGTVEIGSESTNGHTVYFVRDNGTGFDMRYAHKLFGVFQRLHRAEDFEGTGVGLAIVQRIVQRHGGRVWAESTLERGATFHFTLSGGSAS